MVIDPSNSRQSGITQSSSDSGKSRRSEVDMSKKAGQTQTPVKKEAGDSVSLSVTGKSLAQLEASLAGTDEVNVEKVRAIKAAIDNGSYRPDPVVIAEKMLADDSLF